MSLLTAAEVSKRRYARGERDGRRPRCEVRYCRPCPLEDPLDRGGAGVKHACDLDDGEADDVTQQEHRGLS